MHGGLAQRIRLIHVGAMFYEQAHRLQRIPVGVRGYESRIADQACAPMTITQFQYFLAAEAAGSLTGAATALGIAQPTLSEQIRKLEGNLGVPLFTRGKQGLVLTEAGRQFLPHARRVAHEYDDAFGAVADIRDRAGGSVSFGTAYPAASTSTNLSTFSG